MFKSFCDKCGEPGSYNSKKFEVLASSKPGHVLGLDVTALFNKQAASDHHLCEECFVGVVFEALKTFANAKVVRDYFELVRAGGDFTKMKAQLEEREAIVKARHKELDDLLVENRKLAKKNQDESEQISTLMAELQSAKNTMDSALSRRKKLAAA
jgi:hypothetical protein